jgi:hypothetical protein
VRGYTGLTTNWRKRKKKTSWKVRGYTGLAIN